ncbi:MAG: recombinase family protein [Ruminococcus sp.]|nr:recombinase family protein [Ruminococcus sp.]
MYTQQNLIPAVIYARYSSSGQREESIEGQLRECHAYAKHNGFTVVGEYVDKALTGRTDKRPDFQRMLRDSERGIFKAVILWKTDRFARNRYDSAMYKYKLKKNGVRLYYAKESIPEGPEGIILESVMEGYAEYYSENLSQNVKRGNYDSALELKTLGVRVYGLRKSADDHFEPDPETAPIVRRIFEEYAAGERAVDIVARLNAEGFRTINGKLFSKTSLPPILKNEKYLGTYIYKDIRVENAFPAIVTRELFDKCAHLMKRHHRSPAAARDTNFLLTSKLFCGKCGEPMTGDGGTSKTGRVYYYYTCNKRRRHKCDKKRVAKDAIEDFILQKVMEIVATDGFVETVADKVVEYQEKYRDHKKLRALERRQKEVENATNNLMRAIESGIITPTTKSRLVELEAEHERLTKSIAEELIQDATLDRNQIVWFLERVRDGALQDESFRTFLVDTFLNAVYLYDDDNLILVFNYSGNNNTVKLKAAEMALFKAKSSGFNQLSLPLIFGFGKRFPKPFLF